MQSTKVKVEKVFKAEGKGPAAFYDTNRTRYKFWTNGRKGSFDPERFQAGREYLIGYETEQYQGKDTYTVREVSDIAEGQSRPIPQVLQRPHYQAEKSPAESRAIGVAALYKMVPHWFAAIEPNDVAALAGTVNAIGKAWDLSTLGLGAQKENDMEGDGIPY